MDSTAEASEWDAQYLAGEWDRLQAVEEVAHYMVILGYLNYGPATPRVADLGCGHGRLLELLAGRPYESYVGVDISEEAVKRAQALSIPNAEFEVGDFQTWAPSAPLDVVIFNESLYYADQPDQLIGRASQWISPAGMIVVSMFQYDPRAEEIWLLIDRLRGELLGGTTVRDLVSGYSWDIQAFRTAPQ